MDIEIHIEELILEGFPAGDRHIIGEAIGRELTRLFGERDMPSSLAQGRELLQVDGGTIEVDPRDRPEFIGAQLARVVYGGLGQ